MTAKIAATTAPATTGSTNVIAFPTSLTRKPLMARGTAEEAMERTLDMLAGMAKGHASGTDSAGAVIDLAAERARRRARLDHARLDHARLDYARLLERAPQGLFGPELITLSEIEGMVGAGGLSNEPPSAEIIAFPRPRG